MIDFYKNIHTNPVREKRFYRYDVVYLGKVIPNDVDSEEVENLKQRYVFIFSTYLNPQDEDCHGYTYVSIEEEYKISHFAEVVVEQTHFHTITDEKTIFEINDFLEIHKNSSNDGFTISAVLKNQMVYNGKRELIGKRDKNILLVRENLKFENLNPLSLGEEFAIQVKLDWYKQLESKIEDCMFWMNTLKMNSKNEEETTAIATVSKMLKDRHSSLEKMENAYTKIKDGQLY